MSSDDDSGESYFLAISDTYEEFTEKEQRTGVAIMCPVRCILNDS